jgi:hypothetical protein
LVFSWMRARSIILHAKSFLFVHFFSRTQYICKRSQTPKHSSLRIHTTCNPTSMSTSERLSCQIIEIDKVTSDVTLTDISSTTKKITPIKSWNKFRNSSNSTRSRSRMRHN